MLNPSGCLSNSEISPIQALPDEILLRIFDFCREAVVKWTYEWPGPWPWVWRNLVQVCQRWRYAVFSSPHRLDLRIYYSDRHRSSLEEILDASPPFPIEICSFNVQDNLITALEHCDRICELRFQLSSANNWEKLAKVTQMQKLFPALKCLRLGWDGWSIPVPVLPGTFLGGSAPNLRSLYLHRIPFSTLPQLLLSYKDLSELYLRDIPNLGYISPEAMTTVLSSLTKLAYFEIGYKAAGEIRLAPPSTRVVLPTLTVLKFCCANEYSDDLLARIDIPQLETLSIMITCLYELHAFDIRQVIPHSLPLGPFHRAELKFRILGVDIRLYRSEAIYPPKTLELDFTEGMPGFRSEFIAKMYTLSPLLSSVMELDIGSESISLLNDEDVEDLRDNSVWLELFRLFASVRTLRLSSDIQPFIVSFVTSSLLGHTAKSFTDVLPELQNIHLNERRWPDRPLEKQDIELLIANGYTTTVHRLPD